MKTKKALTVVILFFLIVVTVFAASADTIVYITKTGAKYHRGNCSYLRQSKIETTLGSAASRGYDPCSRCKPPVLDE
jgi:endonuclease G